jgi:phospholipase C
VTDYSPHHEPFQYYRSTSNPKHLAPTSVAAIGQTDRANHQYDLSDFDAALAAHNLPAVSFLKAAEYQDGRAGYSDPIDEQHFVVDTIDKLERSEEWISTAVVIAYDDSDGWYDHQLSPIVNGSTDPALDVPGRLPFSKVNFVDHHVTDQTSILKFVEDNWRTGRIRGSSFDARAGRLDSLLDLHKPQPAPVLLAPDGHVISSH